MQGRLEPSQDLRCEIETACARSGRALHIRVDRELRCEVAEADAAPLVFVPIVNFARLRATSIIDDF